jgi:hypothetical protein
VSIIIDGSNSTFSSLYIHNAQPNSNLYLNIGGEKKPEQYYGIMTQNTSNININFKPGTNSEETVNVSVYGPDIIDKLVLTGGSPSMKVQTWLKEESHFPAVVDASLLEAEMIVEIGEGKHTIFGSLTSSNVFYSEGKHVVFKGGAAEDEFSLMQGSIAEMEGHYQGSHEKNTYIISIEYAPQNEFPSIIYDFNPGTATSSVDQIKFSSLFQTFISSGGDYAVHVGPHLHSISNLPNFSPGETIFQALAKLSPNITILLYTEEKTSYKALENKFGLDVLTSLGVSQWNNMFVAMPVLYIDAKDGYVHIAKVNYEIEDMLILAGVTSFDDIDASDFAFT